MGLGIDASLVASALDEPGQAGYLIAKFGELHFLHVSLEHLSEDLEATCLPALLEGQVPVHVCHYHVWSHSLGSQGGLALGCQVTQFDLLHPAGRQISQEAI